MKTNAFTIPHSIVARFALEEFLRSFWWVVLPIPLFGVAAMVFGSGPVQLAGLFSVLWPFTLAARSWLLTARSSRIYRRPTSVAADEQAVLFCPDEGKMLRLRYGAIRLAVRRHSHIVIRTRRGGFLLVAEAAFDDPDEVARFVQVLNERARNAAEVQDASPNG